MLPTIVNVNPGMNRPAPDVREICLILGDAGRPIVTDSIEALERAAREIEKLAPPVVAVWGGDGTIGATVSAIIRAYGDRDLPRFCFLPGGTMNCIARCLGARGTAGSMLARLQRALEEDRAIRAVERTTLKVNERLGFLFGLGMFPNFLTAYDDASHQGPLQALRVFAMMAPGLFRGRYAPDPFFDPFRARLTLGNEVWEGVWTSLSAGGVHCLPLGFRAYTRASERRGAFHFIAHDLKAWGAAYELLSIKLGRGMQRVQQRVTTAVRVELDRELVFNLDGDNFETLSRFDLLAGPTITALVP